MTHVGPVTLLFTDRVNSTELLQRAGDEPARRIFQAHHKLLKNAVAAHDDIRAEVLRRLNAVNASRKIFSQVFPEVRGGCTHHLRSLWTGDCRSAAPER